MSVATIGRRAFLRGAGVTFALPWLEAVAERLPRPLRAPPMRMAIIVTPNGMLPSAWHPVAPAANQGERPANGAEAEIGDSGSRAGPVVAPDWLSSFTLEPLLAHRHQIAVLTGLANRQSFDGDGHYAKVAPLLTGKKIRRTGGRDLWNGVSMDQVAAQQIGGQTLLPSLELACDPIYTVEDMGYSTVYGGHIAWSAPDRPVLTEIVPQQVFDRLFRRRALAADTTRTSVLDAVRRDARRLSARLGKRDRDKLVEYEDSVRSLELRIEAAAKATAPTPMTTAQAPAAGVPREYATHMALMLDLITLAFRTDATRIVTFLTGNEVSGRDFSFLEGCAGNFHEFSHHEGKAEKQEPYRRINRWHTAQFATLIDRLAAIEEGDGSVLDHSMLVLAAAMSDGNTHSPHDLPVVLAGGGGSLPTGRRMASPADTALCRLWLSMLQRMGVDADTFGDATEPLF